MNPIDLAELAGGALQEKSQKALQDVFENMQDPKIHRGRTNAR